MSRRAEIEINKTKMLPNETYRFNGRPFITGKTGKFEKFVTEEELEEFKKAKEAKEILEQAVKEDQKTVIKARIKRQREEKELKESPEMQSEEFAKAKQEYQNAYVDLITAGDDNKKYDKTLEISKQPEFYKLFNAVVNAEKKLNKVTKKLSRLRDDSVYVDSLNIVRELVGDDTNFSAQLPGKPIQPKEKKVEEVLEERTPIDISARLQEAHSNYKSARGDKFDRMIDRQSSVPIDKNKEIIKTQPQTLPPVLQPKKSTQDADRKKKISDEELKRILGS